MKNIFLIWLAFAIIANGQSTVIKTGGGSGGSTNLHSPGPIGDVTPNTGAFTTLTSGQFFATAPINVQHLIQNSWAANNTIALSNRNISGLSVMNLLNNSLQERSAIGWGNGSVGDPFNNVCFIETNNYLLGTFPTFSSSEDQTVAPPTFRIVTTGKINGAFEFYRRMDVAGDGHLRMFDLATTFAGQTAIFDLNQATPTLTLSCPLVLTGTGTLNGNTITTGTGTLTLGSVTLNAGSGGTVGALGYATPAAGFATLATTPTSANLAATITDETGSGSLVFATSPTLVTPALGTPSAVVLTNATSIPAGQLTGTVAAARGGFAADVSTSSGVPLFASGTATFTSTSGTGNFARVTSPTFTTPALGTPSAIVLTNASGLPDSALSANVPLLNASNTFTGTQNAFPTGSAASPSIIVGGAAGITAKTGIWAGGGGVALSANGSECLRVDSGGALIYAFQRILMSSTLGIIGIGNGLDLGISRNAASVLQIGSSPSSGNASGSLLLAGITINGGSKVNGVRHGISSAMTLGSVTVTDSGCTANTRYFFTAHTLGTISIPGGYYPSTRNVGTSFVITSSQATETSTIDWLAIEP